jgi:hypothetical protein
MPDPRLSHPLVGLRSVQSEHVFDVLARDPDPAHGLRERVQGS